MTSPRQEPHHAVSAGRELLTELRDKGAGGELRLGLRSTNGERTRRAGGSPSELLIEWTTDAEPPTYAYCGLSAVKPRFRTLASAGWVVRVAVGEVLACGPDPRGSVLLLPFLGLCGSADSTIRSRWQSEHRSLVSSLMPRDLARAASYEQVWLSARDGADLAPLLGGQPLAATGIAQLRTANREAAQSWLQSPGVGLALESDQRAFATPGATGTWFDDVTPLVGLV